MDPEAECVRVVPSSPLYSSRFDSLGLTPSLQVKLNGFTKVFHGGGEGPALGRHRHVQASSNKPFTVILKHSMDRLHGVLSCPGIGGFARGFMRSAGNHSPAGQAAQPLRSWRW